MRFEPQSIPEVVLIEPRVFGDERGYFKETWSERAFADAGLDIRFVQDNHSRSSRGVLRGLHYQVRHPQGKLVRVLRGAIFDVAVDLRRSSATFGRWVGATLSDRNHLMLWIPPHFAHGFLALEEGTEVAYKCSDLYDPGSERTIRWDDADLAIGWPLPPGAAPILSAKDAAGIPLREAAVFE